MNIEKTILSVEDARILARRRLPKAMYDAIESGSEQELTLQWNLDAFRQVVVRPRVAPQNSRRDLRTTVLGHEISLPVMIAPTGNIRMFHTAGEPGVARVAGRVGTIQIVSCFTGYPIEDVTAQAKGPVFFALYIVGGRANTERMIDRAKRAGCKALVITVDHAARHQKERAVRQRIFSPIGLNFATAMRFAPQMLFKPAWGLDFVRDGMHLDAPMWTKENGKPATFGEMSEATVRESATWADVAWVREAWGGSIVIKGVLHPDDARRAVEAGAAAIVVSNHGGRNVDGCPSSLSVLPEIAEAVKGRLEIYLDSGVRRGTDVVKAVALGARAVLIGRAYVWGHAAAGPAGVERILEIFRNDIDNALASLGCSSMQDLNASYVSIPPSWTGGGRGDA